MATATKTPKPTKKQLEQERADVNWAKHRTEHTGTLETPSDRALQIAHLPRSEWSKLHESGQPPVLRDSFAAFLDKVAIRGNSRKRVFGECVVRLRTERPDLALVLKMRLVDGMTFEQIRLSTRRATASITRDLNEAQDLLNRWFDESAPPKFPAE